MEKAPPLPWWEPLEGTGNPPLSLGTWICQEVDRLRGASEFHLTYSDLGEMIFKLKPFEPVSSRPAALRLLKRFVAVNCPVGARSVVGATDARVARASASAARPVAASAAVAVAAPDDAGRDARAAFLLRAQKALLEPIAPWEQEERQDLRPAFLAKPFGFADARPLASMDLDYNILQIKVDDGAVDEFWGPFVTVGRDSRCDVVVGDASVSELHCVLVLSTYRAGIFDNWSTNGTFVDGVGGSFPRGRRPLIVTRDADVVLHLGATSKITICARGAV